MDFRRSAILGLRPFWDCIEMFHVEHFPLWAGSQNVPRGTFWVVLVGLQIN
jgi:hypothetical protein